MIKAHLNFFIFSLLIFLNSCAQETATDAQETTKDTTEVATEDEWPYNEPHEYGGWYCPDNFGFQPVDITDLSTIPVVQGRMPTKEETQNGTALMYLPPEKFPNAKALKIQLPALAYVKAQYANYEELAIIIQAFVAGTDTIVGYRFPNGGNGSNWIQNVRFLSDKEASQLEATPFFYEEIEVSATKAEIWKTFTKTDFAKELGKKSNNKAIYSEKWSDHLNINLEYTDGDESMNGYAASMWGNLYIHLDYYSNGRHSSKKMLVTQDPVSYKCTIMLASGPYPEDFEAQEQFWNEWLKELKEGSED